MKREKKNVERTRGAENRHSAAERCALCDISVCECIEGRTPLHKMNTRERERKYLFHLFMPGLKLNSFLIFLFFLLYFRHIFLLIWTSNESIGLHSDTCATRFRRQATMEKKNLASYERKISLSSAWPKVIHNYVTCSHRLVTVTVQPEPERI